jgi:pyruvate dehydrogenase E2 component (dihydrolipoyllysine-residue acetyltransferase)
MPTDVIMPKLGLTMETGTVQRWLAEEGQQVQAGDALLEVETDKVVVEVEAAATGTLRAVVVREGENVPIGTVIARIYAPGEKPSNDSLPASRGPYGARPAPAPGPSTYPSPAVARSPGRIFSSPRARKRAREAGLNWQTIQGSGPLGRVIERDVVRATAERPRTAGEQRSGTATPHFYLSAEARADALLALCERLLPLVESRAGVPLTVTDLLVKIAATTLTEHPRANAFWDPADGGRIRLQPMIDVGVAVATGGGLVVPVLHNADRLGLAEIAKERSRLVQKAREGKLSPDDMEGGAFTVADLGAFRVDVFQAVLNPPQSVMLAVGRIADRPVAMGGQTCVRATMVVTLSCDHRVLDGALGAQFLDRVIELIEEPYGLIA